MTADTVRVTYRKYDGALHWHMSGRRLGTDEHGAWVGCPAGTIGQRGNEPSVVWDFAHVMLFPYNSWWTAVFNAAPKRTEIYCDIATVPEWRGDEVTMIDLDLDVIRRRDGTVIIDDEDEFAEHQVRYSYPQAVIERARASCDWLTTAVADGTEPFAATYKSWLSKLD